MADKMSDNIYQVVYDIIGILHNNNVPIGSADFVFKLCKDYMISNTVPYNPNLPTIFKVTPSKNEK